MLRPLVNQHDITLFMATIGLTFFIEGLAQLVWGSEVRKLELGIADEPIEAIMNSTGMVVSKFDVTAAVICGALVAALAFLFNKTKIGRALRAVADDHQAALTVGIPLQHVWGVVWAVAGFVALVAGLLWGARNGVQFALTFVALKALPVLILGGFTSVPGAIVGGLIIGASEKLAEVYVGPFVGGGIEGWFALGTGDAAAAEQHLAAALKQRPETETAILLSRALVAQKKLESSQEVLEEWLKQHPRDLIVLLHLAGGYLSQNRNEQAISTYARVIEHYPDHVPSLNNLAWLNRDKDPKRAMDYANQARRLAPNDPYVLDTLGQLALNEGDAGRALGLLREAARHAPAEPEIQLHLAAALIKQERLAEAEQILTPLASTLASKLPDSPLAREAKTLLDAAKARKR